jgi:hypothetical protein
MMVNDDLEKMRNEMVVNYFEMLFQNWRTSLSPREGSSQKPPEYEPLD